MGKNQNSVVVPRIRLKFWWMIPMGVRDNHTKYERETQRWRPGTAIASGGPQFQKLQFRAKNSHFLDQNSPRTHSKRPNKGKGWVHSTCALTFPCQRALCCPLTPPYVPETAQKGPRSPEFCADGLATATNQEQAISLATWLKMRFRGHLVHPQPPTFCGFHPSELPKRTPRPPYVAPAGGGKLQAQAQTGGCPIGSTGSGRGKK